MILTFFRHSKQLESETHVCEKVTTIVYHTWIDKNAFFIFISKYSLLNTLHEWFRILPKGSKYGLNTFNLCKDYFMKITLLLFQ